MTPSEFEAALAQLKREHGSRSENRGCIECEDCKRSVDCTFCRRSDLLVRCNYCVDCERCTDCNHCHGAGDLLSCTHCVGCERCARSAYLERCSDCSDCQYCFGCVGLSGREFHILNQPYERRAYFELQARLRRAR